MEDVFVYHLSVGKHFCILFFGYGRIPKELRLELSNVKNPSLAMCINMVKMTFFEQGDVRLEDHMGVPPPDFSKKGREGPRVRPVKTR